jgi:carnitine 3-dehydrogenase
MAHMLDHFGPSLLSPWTRLTAPELTQELRDAVVTGCDDEADGRSFEDLVTARDSAIIQIRQLVGELRATLPGAVEHEAPVGGAA